MIGPTCATDALATSLDGRRRCRVSANLGVSWAPRTRGSGTRHRGAPVDKVSLAHKDKANVTWGAVPRSKYTPMRVDNLRGGPLTARVQKHDSYIVKNQHRVLFLNQTNGLIAGLCTTFHSCKAYVLRKTPCSHFLIFLNSKMELQNPKLGPKNQYFLISTLIYFCHKFG